ncbi:MAG: hypothetical protein H7Y88_04470 [Phycisphaerales bacterium]|nr:hypothetical protein [Phycisphaerales bacterium]
MSTFGSGEIQRPSGVPIIGSSDQRRREQKPPAKKKAEEAAHETDGVELSAEAAAGEVGGMGESARPEKSAPAPSDDRPHLDLSA